MFDFLGMHRPVYMHLYKLFSIMFLSVFQIIHELKQEHDLCLSQRREANRTTPVVEIIDAEKHHMAVELADVKSKLRHSRHEL